DAKQHAAGAQGEGAWVKWEAPWSQLKPRCCAWVTGRWLISANDRRLARRGPHPPPFVGRGTDGVHQPRRVSVAASRSRSPLSRSERETVIRSSAPTRVVGVASGTSGAGPQVLTAGGCAGGGAVIRVGRVLGPACGRAGLPMRSPVPPTARSA